MEFGPQSITMGQVQIRYYGIIIVAAILVAATVAARLAKREGKDPDHIWGAMFGAVILGIIGARLWFVLFPPQSLIAAGKDTAWFFENFFNLQDGAIAIWSGGLHIFGAFLGGFLGAYIYLRQNKLNVLDWLDIAAVALPLGQAIGRIANAVNQELYGGPTGSDWFGLIIESKFRVAPYTSTIDYPLTTRFHPLFAYEAVWSFAAFILLLYLWQHYRKVWRPGTFFFLYVAQYAFIRYILEFVRVELSIIDLGGTRINVTQAIAIVAFLISAPLAYMGMNSPRPATPVVTSEKQKTGV